MRNYLSYCQFSLLFCSWHTQLLTVLRIHFFVLQIQVLVTNKTLSLRPYRRPGDNIIYSNL